MVQQKNLKIIPLGGFQEVGRNMMVVEYENDIIIIDMGLQFPDEDMPGIDYIIPNITYLKDKKHKIRGVIITHGHYDHIGAIPHLIGQLGNPPIYTMPLTAAIIKKRQEDFPQSPVLDIHELKKTDKVSLGCFNVGFFHVNHNIPDNIGIVINTPVGNIVHTSDFKFDDTPIGDYPTDMERLEEISQSGVLCLLSDSTGAEIPGSSISEKTIQENLEIIFQRAKGRIIVATFASLISRVQEIINLAEKYNRKVFLDGYSMKMNVEIAKKLGYIKAQKGTLIKMKQLKDYPDDQIVVMCTGAQGEDNAVLMRIVNREHRHVQLQKGDFVVFSSSVVPGNERTVQGLKDNIWRQGARVYHYHMMDIHASGHAFIDDLQKMLEIMKPKFFLPIHGHYYMLLMHSEIAQKTGVKAENCIIAQNGRVVKMTTDKIWASKMRVPTSYVMVDGLGVGDVGQIVLRDRQVMSVDGIFVIIAVVDTKTGRVKTSPDIISRGFIYLRESKELLAEARKKSVKIIEDISTQTSPINTVYIKDNIRDKIGEFLYTKTQRRPMVVPVVIEV